MRKDENYWKIGELEYSQADDENYRTFSINGEKHFVQEKDSALVHAVLLLVDAINDKKIST